MFSPIVMLVHRFSYRTEVLSLKNLVDRSNGQSQELKWGKIPQFALSQVTFIGTFVWILGIWNLAVISALYLTNKVAVRFNTSRDLHFMSDIYWNFHGLNKCQAIERWLWAAALQSSYCILFYSSNTLTHNLYMYNSRWLSKQLFQFSFGNHSSFALIGSIILQINTFPQGTVYCKL